MTRAERKLLFNNAVDQYAKYRPFYTNEFFNYVVTVCHLDKDSSILEIGCGTGQSSDLFIREGYSLTAVEIGLNLVEYIKNQYKDFSNFKVFHSSFEDYHTDETFDLILSASAFHWLEFKSAIVKCHQLLKENGNLLLCWNSRNPDKMDDLYLKIQEIYRIYAPELTEKHSKNSIHDTDWKVELDKTDLFKNVFFKSFDYQRILNEDEYTGLLGTYSDHLALPQENRELLFENIKKVIKKNGSQIIIPYSIKTFYAQKK